MISISAKNNGNIKTFGEYLRDLRKDKGLTLVQLQNESGVSNSYLSQIENNQFKPSNDVLEKISTPLNVSVLDLMIALGDIPEMTIKAHWDAEASKFEYGLNLKHNLQQAYNSMNDMAYYNSDYYNENNDDGFDKIKNELEKIDLRLDTLLKDIRKFLVMDRIEDSVGFNSLLEFIDNHLKIENINEKRKSVYYFLQNRDDIILLVDMFLDSLSPTDFMSDEKLEEYSYEQNRALELMEYKQLKYPDIDDILKLNLVYFKGKLLDERSKSLSKKILNILTEDLEVNYPTDEEIELEFERYHNISNVLTKHFKKEN